MKYEAQTFNIGELKGISNNTVSEHLKLYEGYVKNTNLILEKISDISSNTDNAYPLAEAWRRFSFEFNGMRNHEYYFKSLEGGASEISKDSKLYKKISETWGSFENWLGDFKTLAKMRGVGWAMLYFDKQSGSLLNSWVDEQHLGQLNGCEPILALDMWEHSFVADYNPSGKGQYIEDFFANLNWKVIENNFDKVS